MSPFKRVANEIIIRIIEETSADDVVSLASCCKHFSALAQNRLAFHRHKRATAPDIVTGWHQDWDEDIHPSKHLQNILKNDDSRFYTKVMKIGFLDYGQGRESEIQALSTLIAHVGTKYGHRLTALVANSYAAILPDVKGYGLEELTKDVKEGKAEAVILLLLTLYPNLETLELFDINSTWSEGVWGRFFYSLVEVARNPVRNTLRVFSKVSKLVLLGNRGDDGEAAEMVYVDIFMELPTVREILGDIIDARDLQGTVEMGTSNTTHLAFKGDVDGASLESLIGSCRALECFIFQLYTLGDWSRGVDREDELNSLKFGPQADNDIACVESKKASSYGDVKNRDETNRPTWEPRGIVKVLLHYASNSLVSLMLTALGLEAVVPLSDDEPFIFSLRSFRALKVVLLDTMMLFKKTGPSISVSSSPEKPQQQTLWEDMRPHPLVSFLPVTIEDFGMTSGFVGQGLSREDVMEMFSGLPDARTQLPKLQIIRAERNEMEQSQEEEDGELELSERCHENDIQFWYKEPEEDTWNVSL